MTIKSGGENAVIRKDTRRMFPHCDARVLHAPGECHFCDRSELQDVREAWGINFTGHYEEGKYLCPAEDVRGLENIERWSGNCPTQLPQLPVIPSIEEVKKRRRSLVEALKSFARPS